MNIKDLRSRFSERTVAAQHIVFTQAEFDQCRSKFELIVAEDSSRLHRLGMPIAHVVDAVIQFGEHHGKSFRGLVENGFRPVARDIHGRLVALGLPFGARERMMELIELVLGETRAEVAAKNANL